MESESDKSPKFDINDIAIEINDDTERTNQNSGSNTKPNHYLRLSIIVNALFCCFGCMPLIYSVRSRDSFKRGQVIQATVTSKRAKQWNIAYIIAALLTLTTLVTVFLIIYYFMKTEQKLRSITSASNHSYSLHWPQNSTSA